MNTELLREKYLNAHRSFIQLMEKEEKYLLILSVSRLFTFICSLILIWIVSDINLPAGLFLTLILTIFFLYLLKLYSIHSERKEFLCNLAKINQEEADAISGDYSAFESGSVYIETAHDFSNDVDLFGSSSVFQYLNRTVTGYGRDILAHWLSEPYSLASGISWRQEVIKELSLKEKWRQEFLASGMRVPLERKNIKGLIDWISEEAYIGSSSIKKFMIYFLPSVAIGSLLMMITGILPYPVFILFFLVNLLCTAAALRKTNKVHNALSQKYMYLNSINGLLKIFERESFTSRILTEIKLNVCGKEVSAAISVRKLSRLIQAFDSRMNILVGFILNGLLLWDFQCIYRLEKWKSEGKNLFPVWLEMLGQVDAYISLGNYAFNNPGFVYPDCYKDSILFSAKGLGHPLIDETKRICNDFTLDRRGTVCIISGANMAGKSTFLRTVAVNYILGMTGAPVCASSMKFSPVKLFTSMRTTDSLSENESYFYAELRRLKKLKSMIEHDDQIFFILDEILKGTNSEDKSLGSKLFLRRIIEYGGSGLIATHDTSLGELEIEYPGVVLNKCFEIEIDGETIIFDYKLQNGITLKMNAALLMKQMGILD